jgi:hypothetical protein
MTFRFTIVALALLSAPFAFAALLPKKKFKQSQNALALLKK